MDFDKINKLPYEEYMEAMGDLTQTQVKEYVSRLQLKESNEPMQAIRVNYNRDDQRSGIDAIELIQKLRNMAKRDND